MVEVKRRSGGGSALTFVIVIGGAGEIRACIPSAAEADSENPEAAFPFRETLKGRLLEMVLALMQSSVDLCQIGPR